MTEHLIISLIYEQSIESSSEWEAQAYELRRLLEEDVRNGIILNVNSISIIGRSKGLKLVVGTDSIIEELTLADGRVLRYRQIEEAFSNPNGAVSVRALDWICARVQSFTSSSTATADFDFLELYCGNGNHTVAISPYVKRLVAVELNPSLVLAARLFIFLFYNIYIYIFFLNQIYKTFLFAGKTWK